MSFWLLPQLHASTNRSALMAHRRLLEDKIYEYPSCHQPICHYLFVLLVQRNTNQRNNPTNRINPIFISSSPRTCDIFEVAVNFLDAEHRGDRRKKSQQCYLPNCCSLLFSHFHHPNIFTQLRYPLPTAMCLCVHPNHIQLLYHIISSQYITPPRCGRCQLRPFRGRLRQKQGTPWQHQWDQQGESAGSAKPGPRQNTSTALACSSTKIKTYFESFASLGFQLGIC